MLRVQLIRVAMITLAVCGVARASDPAVVGNLHGLEIAQQTSANPAVFVGLYAGTVGGKFAFGAWAAGINHNTPLPDGADESIDITSGQWQLEILVLQGFRLKRVALSGGISGTLSFADTDLFSIEATMSITSGGSGNIFLDGSLDHTIFPPGISATLSQ